jgi:hypothetical protein
LLPETGYELGDRPLIAGATLTVKYTPVEGVLVPAELDADTLQT